jgi:tRNA threonylcarbamoyladenosine biosynthesis protein TsaB
MTLLSIDSTGQTASVAITNPYITVAEISANAPSRHAELLLPMVDELFKLSGLSLEQMDAIVCVNGPGSFTGLRIGAATAMGLARGAGKGLICVPTPDALAYNIISAADDNCYIIPMLDARREQVYTAVYQAFGGILRRESDYMALPIHEALAYVKDNKNKRVVFLGDGAFAYEAIIREAYPAAVFAPANASRQRAASAGVCAAQMLKDGYTLQSDVPLMYIRKPQAVREREHDTR